MEIDKGWEFLFRERHNSGPYSDEEGNTAYINSDGSGVFYGADGGTAYLNADGSGTYYGTAGSTGYKNSDGSGVFYGADGSTNYINADTSHSNYLYDSDKTHAYKESEPQHGGSGGKADAGATILVTGIIGLLAIFSLKSTKKELDRSSKSTNGESNEATTSCIQPTEKMTKKDYVIVLVSFGIALLVPLCILLGSSINKWTAERQGKISAGFSKDLVGEDYKTVDAYLRAAGFTNIEIIDLNDSGLAFWKNGKVAAISIGGKTEFESTDYFYPDTPIVISYH